MAPVQNNKKIARNGKRQSSYTELAFLSQGPLLSLASAKLLSMQAYAPQTTKEKVS
jgi:hypothetical protein